MRSIIKFVALAVFVPLPFFLTAQDKSQSSIIKKELVYERLAETQREYNEIIKTGDSLQVAEVCYLMGKRYIGIGDYNSSEKWFIRALRILEPLDPSESLGKIYMFRSEFLIRNKKFDEAIESVQKSVVNFRSVGAMERLNSAYRSIGGIFLLGNNARLKEPFKYRRFTLDSALYYFTLGDRLGGNLKKNKEPRINIFRNNSFVYIYNDTSTAIKDLKKSYNFNLKQSATSQLFGNAAELGSVYLSFNNFREAKNWLDRAIKITDTSKVANFEQKIILFKLYSELNKKTHNYEEALKYIEKAHELELEGVKVDQDGAISRIKIEYETQKKELALKEQQKFTKIAISLGLFALIVSIVFFLLFKKYRMISRQNAILVEEQNHRVKNYLQQVSNLIILQRLQLSDDKTKTSLSETLQRIEAMAQVQRKLYDSKRLIEIELRTFIPNLTESILPSYSIFNCQPEYKIDGFWLHVDQTIPFGLILNEVVTNSCKYAFTNTASEPQLKIECRLENDVVKLVVVDNGPGFEIAVTKGFGLKLLKAFSERLKGEYCFQDGGREFHLSFKRKTNLSSK